MNVFKFLLVFSFAIFTACDNGIDYIIHSDGGDTDIVYVEMDPDAEVWVDSFTQAAMMK